MSGISSNEKKSKHKGMLNWNLFLIVVILFEFLIFGAANQKFLNISSMFRSMNDFVPIGIIGIFVTLVMITGGINRRTDLYHYWCCMAGLGNEYLGCCCTCNCDRYLMWNADWIFYRILWRTGDGRNIRWKFLICRTCPDGFYFE